MYVSGLMTVPVPLYGHIPDSVSVFVCLYMFFRIPGLINRLPLSLVKLSESGFLLHLVYSEFERKLTLALLNLPSLVLVMHRMIPVCVQKLNLGFVKILLPAHVRLSFPVFLKSRFLQQKHCFPVLVRKKCLSRRYRKLPNLLQSYEKTFPATEKML